jgi:cytochrome c biogenesis factor
MFKLLGVVVGVYTFAAALKGTVYARSGVWGRAISKHESPDRFWMVIAIYAALSVALLTVF